MQEDETIEEYIALDDSEKEGKKSWKQKLENFLNSRYFLPVIIILVAIIAFSLGRISGLQDKRPPVRIISDNTREVKGASTSLNTVPASSDANLSTSSGQVIASKNGTKYHYPWCAGAKQISDKNKIVFNSIEEARAAGYTPASNCKGLK